MHEFNHMAENHEIEPVFDLPEIIDTPYPYISMRDLRATSTALAPDTPKDVTDNLENILQELRESSAPEGSTFYIADGDAMNKLLEKRVDDEVSRHDISVGVIHMDRHIGANQQGSGVIRLDISRDRNNQLTSRAGADASVEEQLLRVVDWANTTKPDEIIFVDDVVAFGDTLPVIVDELRTTGLSEDIKIRALVGLAASGGSWNGLEKMQDTAGIDTEYLTKIIASPEIPGKTLGMAIPVSRDLTLLGGKVSTLDDGAKRIHPYILPFSKPLSSIIRPEIQLDASKKLLAFNHLLIETLEQYARRTLRIQDLIDKNLGVPATSLDFLDGIMEAPDSRTPLTDYISYALSVLDENEELILQNVAVDSKKY